MEDGQPEKLCSAHRENDDDHDHITLLVLSQQSRRLLKGFFGVNPHG